MAFFRSVMIEPIHPAQIAALKKMTDEEKFRAVCEMWNLAREMLATQIRTNHHDWAEEEVWKEVRRRLINGNS
jgi:Rv0078B-related antitoxin